MSTLRADAAGITPVTGNNQARQHGLAAASPAQPRHDLRGAQFQQQQQGARSGPFLVDDLFTQTPENNMNMGAAFAAANFAGDEQPGHQGVGENEIVLDSDAEFEDMMSMGSDGEGTEYQEEEEEDFEEGVVYDVNSGDETGDGTSARAMNDSSVGVLRAHLAAAAYKGSRPSRIRVRACE